MYDFQIESYSFKYSNDFSFFNSAFSQETDEKSERSINHRYAFFDYRGSNAVALVGGYVMMESDYPESEFDLYFRIGYKYHITSYLNINVSYSKYNVTVNDVYSEGFMSFDLNLEILFSPHTKFLPFLYVGGGYNASNYYVSTAAKAQGGCGFEIIVTKGIGLKLIGEYNYMFADDHLDGLIANETIDTLLRGGLGLNLYFGGKKKRKLYVEK
ncbi:curli production assembly/transport component CsgG [Winogradskyella psychrotolerans RS-3]|uniref:Curli production assembly/transport component CsgG n=1 Tax=Winogradskyella psychrotolerans RS-3 TaxID=641526 RepID=S7VUB2_9FLAO|nr:hypothetical protein [Winogradskyella psychrotolerans]EPR73870.1 curli production assembly/transport component CsgG [Winogradskyella psychrotolerans RS-3]